MKTYTNSHSTRNLAWLGLGIAAGAGWAYLSRRHNKQRTVEWKSRMEREPSRLALVTGASAGIGASYARVLAGQGYHLVLVARREERLKQLANELRECYGTHAEVLPADLSTEEGIAKVENRITSGGDIDFLVNNAAYDVFGFFAQIPIEKTLALINCLELACVRFCRAALPGMLTRGHGAIVNVSSIGAFTPKPRDSVYVASKAYLNMFSESLAIELAGSGMRIQALCPGFTRTEFHDAPEFAEYHIKERIPSWLWMEPEEVVAASLQALSEDRRICVPGWKNQAIAFAARSGLSRALLKLMASFFPQSSDRSSALAPQPQLDLLACPSCHTALSLHGNWESGALCCSACGREYPIVDGIPHFIEYDQLSGQDRDFARLYDWFSYIYRLFSRLALGLLGGEAKLRHELLDRLELDGGPVLEVSIGPGVNLPILYSHPRLGDIYGLDISLGQLRGCQGYARKHGFPVRLFLGNAECLPYQDNSFESVFHIGGINFFSDKAKAIREMIRVAKPGAKIVIADETERGAHGYELALPGFGKIFQQKREPVHPPVDLIPANMQDVRLDETVWKGWFYCIEFRKPQS